MNNDLVIIELDKPRTLKYGIKALKTIEKIFNCKITKLDTTELGTDEIMKIILAGLAWEDADLTVEKLEDLIDTHTTFGVAINKMTEAIGNAFGTKNA